jgi:hypothetical protein
VKSSAEILAAVEQRRQFLLHGSLGMGSVALGALLNGMTTGAAADSQYSRNSSPYTAKLSHFAPTAKQVIFLFMAGAPSQLDLFDYKPKLNEMHGSAVGSEVMGDDQFPNIKPERRQPTLLGSPYSFQQHGESGAWVSELLPHLTEVVDDLTFIKSMYSDANAIDHSRGQLFLASGAAFEGRPSLGAWLSYGLGSENENLPAFVVLVSNNIPRGGPGIYGSGFLPGVHQGVPFRSAGNPVLFLRNPNGMTGDTRRRSIETINDLNRMRSEIVGDPHIATRVAAFEMAYRMQTSVPELTDLSSEPQHIHDMYGTKPGQRSFANNCLLARRLVEQGVRIVQLVDLDWDHHGDTPKRDLVHALPKQCLSADQAAAALIRDLKQRDLLDETLVIFAGEFGRTPMIEDRRNKGLLGRDHHVRAFTIWMAGGGVKSGMTYGATDELGYAASENRVHMHDLHATILHLMGIDHKQLTYRFQGRDFRLTDVAGNVVHDVLL